MLPDFSSLFIHPVMLFAGLALGAVGVWFAMPRGNRAPRELGALVAAAGVGLVLLGLLLRAGGELPNLFFYVFAAISLGSALRVITHPRPVYAALFFVLTVISGAGMYILLSAEFLAFALIIIYAGAILITYLFVIMLATQAPSEEDLDRLPVSDSTSRAPLGAVVAGFLLLAALTGMFNSGLRELPEPGAVSPDLALERLPLKIKRELEARGFPGAIEVGRDEARGTMINARPEAMNMLVRLDYEKGIPFIKRFQSTYASTLPAVRQRSYLRDLRLVRDGRVEPMFAANETVDPLSDEAMELFFRVNGVPVILSPRQSRAQAESGVPFVPYWSIMLTIPENVRVTNLEAVGFALLSEHPLALELAGVILLMSLVGAVVIARKHAETGESETAAAAVDAGRSAA